MPRILRVISGMGGVLVFLTALVVQSPGFMTATLVLGFIFLALLFGVLGGSLGWCGATLVAWAWTGRRAIR